MQRADGARRGEAVGQLSDSAVTPDIILADYHLDDGTGIEAVAAVRARRPLAGAGHRHHRRSFGRRCSAQVRLRGFALLRKPLKAAALRALMYQLTWQRAVAAE